MHLTVNKVTFVSVAVGKVVYTLARSYIVKKITLVSVVCPFGVLAPGENAFACSFVVLPVAHIFAAVCVVIGTLAFFVIIDVIAFIPIPVGPAENTFAMHLTVNKVALVSVAVGKVVYTLAGSLAV